VGRTVWRNINGIPVKLSRKGVILPSGKKDYYEGIESLSEAGLVSSRNKLLTGSVCKMCKGKGSYGDAICENCYGVGKTRNKNFGIGQTGRYLDRRDSYISSRV
jgi:hypothetical protein